MNKDPELLVKELERTKKQLDFSKKITEILSEPVLSLEEKLQNSLTLILDEIQAHKGSIMLLEEDGNSLSVKASTRKHLIGKNQPIDSESITGYVCQNRSPLLIKDITKDQRFRARSKTYSTDSLLSVPIISLHGDQLIGIIHVSDQKNHQPFTEENLDTILNYSHWISPLLENSCLIASLEEEKTRYQNIAEELELKQKELIIASTERSELVEMVVHDFKSPLSAIISNLDLLQYLGADEEQKPIIETALEGSKKLLDMINDFLEIARLDHWQNEDGRLVKINLLPVIQELLVQMQPTAQAKKITLELDSDRDLYVIGQDMLLHHLLQNLLSNAIKYTPPGGDIRIGWNVLPSKRSGDMFSKVAKICVEDTGIGIPEEMKRVIFQKFSRGNRELDGELKGTGIGLFICQKIVSIFKGRIWVEDVKPEGSRFCFTMYSPNYVNESGEESE